MLPFCASHVLDSWGKLGQQSVVAGTSTSGRGLERITASLCVYIAMCVVREMMIASISHLGGSGQDLVPKQKANEISEWRWFVRGDSRSDIPVLSPDS